MSARSVRDRAARSHASEGLGPSDLVGPPTPFPFALVIGLASFLLFSLELLAGRLVLPVFGGAPAVWTTALVLFTGLLFAGYLYAHLVATRLGPARGARVHLVVVFIAVVVALFAPADVASLRVPGIPEALNVLYALLLLCGAPIFLLSTTTPLVSSWYASRDSDPWWLYAVSNAASFGALLTYPLLLERFVPLAAQRTLVAVVLIAYALVLAAIVLYRPRRAGLETSAGHPRRRRPRASHQPQEVEVVEPVARRRQLRWLLAAFVPAGLLSATTNFIATDLVSAPLVWVGPLAIYLLSFVVAFSERGRSTLRYVELLVPAAATLLWIPFIIPTGLSVGAMLLIELGCYAVLAIALHGRLALDRPSARHLTRFYLILSAGGFLATIFVALFAPVAFPSIYEYPLLIVAAIVVLALMPGPRPMASLRRPRRPSLSTLGGVAASLVPFIVLSAAIWLPVVESPDTTVAVGVLVAAGGVGVILARNLWLLAVTTALSIAVFSALLAEPAVERLRTFFGVIEVRQEGPMIKEFSGTTLHGVQFRDARAREPTSYYVRAGPLGDCFADVRVRTDPARIAAVGLGTGTIATYAMPRDQLDFFEIDPGIVDIARSGEWFTYLADASVQPRIVMGDARLSLADQPDDTYDLIVLDAFSSDSVPVHLLTREAIQMYERKLRPEGILCFHVSNRFYDLGGAVSATARSVGLEAAGLSYQPGPTREAELAANASEWVVVGPRESVARFVPAGWSTGLDGPVLTDDFSDLLSTLR